MATIQERVEEQAGREPVDGEKHRSLRQDVWRQFKKHKGALVGLVLLGLIVFATIFGPIIYGVDPYEIDTSATNAPPSVDHPLGTDNLGRDVLARTLIGGRISLAVGFAAMLFGLFLGTGIGIVSGFFRKLDGPLMRITDLFLALPILPLLLVIIMLFRDSLARAFGEELGIFLLVVFIIGVTSWMQTARVVRGDVLGLKEEEFVLAANSIGTRKRKIITRHILPNTLSPVMVSAALGVAVAIITESALSFLGLGFPASFPTWGRLLFDGNDYLQLSPLRAIVPGVMISLTVMSVNYIGDGLRDALDPKLRSK
ncbi:MAG TPA: ABC transporter permease [Acidimicrobiia bacterium]|jgi:peptide/nickel transport system permease protein|nr:ABC transporter permease [Acidimicrobiia bacterium]